MCYCPNIQAYVLPVHLLHHVFNRVEIQKISFNLLQLKFYKSSFHSSNFLYLKLKSQSIDGHVMDV